MPYSADGSNVPAHVKGKKKRRQFAVVWNSVYRQTGSESRAFAAANSVTSGKKKAKKILDLDLVISSKLHKILTKESSSLYADTGEYDEEEENHLREELVIWADYAEDGPTFDPSGDYLCGSCDMRQGESDCMRVVSPISFETGSCRIFTLGEPEDKDPMPQKLTYVEAVYSERPNEKGFGCSRCMYSSEAKAEDSDGRPSWCSYWGLHIIPEACCFKNSSGDDIVPGTTEKILHSVRA